MLIYCGSNFWIRLLHEAEPNAPVIHVHHCPECFESPYCDEPCTLEPDLELDDGTPCGSFSVCEACQPV